MFASSSTTERLADTPTPSPPHDQRLAIPLSQTLARTPSNSSALSCSSSSELVPRHRQSRTDEPSFRDWLMTCRRNKQTLYDSEKNTLQSSGSSPPPMKPWHGWRLILMGSWLNVLILLIPASWVLMIASNESHTLIFIFCILAMIPLVKLHDLATRELSIRLGGTKTGLLNASMSNIVEIVVAFTALRKCELRVVQSSLIGSMLSKLLLILGMCFFAGGMRFTEQDFDPTATQIHSSLLSISVGAVLLPAAFHFALSYDLDDGVSAVTSMNQQKQSLLKMSHGVSIVLLFIYAAYLIFLFWSHSHLYKDNKNGNNGRLPNSPSARSITERLQAAKNKISPKGKTTATPNPQYSTNPYAHPAHVGVSQETIAGPEYPGKLYTSRRINERSSPYMNKSHSSSDEEVYMQADTSTPTSSRSAYLISPFATTSQVTLTAQPQDMDVTPPPGSTIRLVEVPGNGHAQVYANEYELEQMRRRKRSVTNSPYVNGSSGDGRVSPADDIINAYLSEKGNHFVEVPLKREHGYQSTGQYIEESLNEEPEEQESKPQPAMSWTLTLVVMVIVTVLVAINAEWLVDSMDELSPDAISKEWIALILLPAVASLAECFTAVNVSVKDQLNLSISVAVGSTIQTALFVIPFMVILGWIMDKPLALLFDPFESVVLYISVHTMGYVVQDGRSNWLEGMILVCLYIVIAVSFWFYPGSNFSTNLAVCSTSVF